MLPREYTLSQYDSSPPLTACKIVVILIDSSFVEQVEEYTCLNTDSSGKSYRADISYLPWTPKFTGDSEARVAQSLDLLVVFCWPLIVTLTIVLYVI
jgi:hypothetical protein